MTPTVLTTSSILEGPWHVIIYNLLRHQLEFECWKSEVCKLDKNVTVGFPRQAMHRENYQMAFEQLTLTSLRGTLWGKKNILILHLKLQDLHVVGTGKNLLIDCGLMEGKEKPGN